MQIGMSRVPFRWSVGLPLAGYLNRILPAVGSHRELYLRAAVFSSDDQAVSLCLLSGEVLSVDSALTRRLRDAIGREFGLPPQAVMLAATHTHASAAGLTHFPVPGQHEAVFGVYAPERVDQFVAVALTAVRQAFAARRRVSLFSGVGQTQGIAANRRDPAGLHDPSLPFLLARDDSGAAPASAAAAVLSYACHPTILSADNRLYSGDLIGTACALLEASGQVVLGLIGAAGDISTRFTRRESSTAEVERMAAELARAVQSAELRPLPDERLGCACQPVTLPVNPAPDRDQLAHMLARARARLAATPPAHPQRRVVEAEVEGLEVQVSLGQRPDHIDTEVQVFALGRAFIVALPGELFVQYGLELIAALAPAPVLIAGCANDYVGYVTTPQAASGYEADSAIVPPEAGALLLKAALTAVERCAASSRP